jgi:hypothetical protein
MFIFLTKFFSYFFRYSRFSLCFSFWYCSGLSSRKTRWYLYLLWWWDGIMIICLKARKSNLLGVRKKLFDIEFIFVEWYLGTVDSTLDNLRLNFINSKNQIPKFVGRYPSIPSTGTHKSNVGNDTISIQN